MLREEDVLISDYRVWTETAKDEGTDMHKLILFPITSFFYPYVLILLQELSNSSNMNNLLLLHYMTGRNIVCYPLPQMLLTL
jgi:hypothetical protein